MTIPNFGKQDRKNLSYYSYQYQWSIIRLGDIGPFSLLGSQIFIIPPGIKVFQPIEIVILEFPHQENDLRMLRGIFCQLKNLRHFFTGLSSQMTFITFFVFPDLSLYFLYLSIFFYCIYVILIYILGDVYFLIYI